MLSSPYCILQGLCSVAGVGADPARIPLSLGHHAFIVLLTAVVDEFGIDKANEKIKKKLTLANMLPFTDGAAQAEALERELLA